MLASLLRRPKKRQIYAARSSTLFKQAMTGNGEIPIANEAGSKHSGANDETVGQGEGAQFEEVEDEDDPQDSSPLLPIFSASHLDSLPVYRIIRAIRPLIVSRCETTLSWEQLKSPQVSQFLVKPILQKILASHFSRATLYALMTNCLQFTKEIDLNPANSGISCTRALLSELLATKLLKEYTARELIDALSYEFYPLQGQPPSTPGNSQWRPGWSSKQRNKSAAGAARISCLEIAIRAQAKRFLAHPVVVQQLEAIWAGTILFNSVPDHLHRQSGSSGYYVETYGATQDAPASNPTSSQIYSSEKGRRSVTLYDPRDASLFKLSRLRVPRYRQFLSTISFAVLLGLFLAVLNNRYEEITSLELVFWFWSAGYLLDEIVCFNEQGFSLYLMSFWNVFDLGILLLLFCYYCMRMYGSFISHSSLVTSRAYDILAANAVLLFPRLFSVLDHYQYFSQLLIAFRIMATDLVAVCVLVIIACSGFFVTFMSIGNAGSPASVAFALFQMLMGFTPAAWSLWDEYDTLGKVILTVFLFICHFVVVTILITVLTNSFMGIVQNAHREHQFLFAVNTISMVKSDALFSYVAPTNIFAWLITPLRYVMPFGDFVRLNRSVIKMTHLPILLAIWFYEKAILSSRVVEPTDLEDAGDRGNLRQGRFHSFSLFNLNHSRLVREPSVATYHKDRALEEVFRRTLDDRTQHPISTMKHQKSSKIVANWMRSMDPEAVNPPDEQDSDWVNELERMHNRGSIPPRRKALAGPLRRLTTTTRSDPEEMHSSVISPPAIPRRARDFFSASTQRRPSRHADTEGDDELTSESNEDDESTVEGRSTSNPSNGSDGEDDGKRIDGSVGSPGEATTQFYSSRPSTARIVSRKPSPTRRSRLHRRTRSGPIMSSKHLRSQTGETPEQLPSTKPRALRSDADKDPDMVRPKDKWTWKRDFSSAILSHSRSIPDYDRFNIRLTDKEQPSILSELGSELGDNKANNGNVAGEPDLPGSFTTQLVFATGGIRRAGSWSISNQDMLSKLVLVRMNNLEEGFREIIKEVKDLRLGASSGSQSWPDQSRSAGRDRKERVD